jgi:hypothetical protein
VLLVIIGTEWLDAKDDHGVRRLSDPLDYVRIETSYALKRDIRVIPVLVRGAKMPAAEQLPDELKEVAYRNCIELTHTRWRSDVQILTEALRRVLAETSQPAAPVLRATATPTQPGASQQDRAAGSKTNGPAALQIDPVALARVTRQLAFRIGPIADIVVKRAASQCHSLEELYQKVSEEIDSREERDKFLRERTATPSATPPRAKAPPIAASQPAATHASASTMQAETHEQRPREAPPARRPRASSKPNYWLFALAGIVLLFLALILVNHFASKHDAGSSQPEQSLQPAAVVPADNKAAAPPAPDGSGKSQSATPKRVYLTEDESSKLRISIAPLTYPVLARHGHSLGSDVLDAIISREGRVE